MGAWGGLCVFDVDLYQREIVSAFRAGESHPLIAAEIERLIDHARLESRFRGLAEVAARFDDQMLETDLGRGFQVVDGRLSDARGESGTDSWGYENLADLFEQVVITRAVSHVAWFGRTYSLFALFDEAEGPHPEYAELVETLSSRARFWTHGSGGFSEGIHGWLTAPETERLVAALPVFPAPVGRSLRYDGPLDRVRTAIAERAEHAGKLVRFEEVARLAAHLGRGLLWGADLRILYRDTYPQLFADSSAAIL